jgi:WD40 repeat protein
MTRRFLAVALRAALTVAAAVALCLGAAQAQDQAQEKPEVFPQIGHSQGVFALAFSPDGKTLASGAADNTVKLWDVESRREIRTLGPGLPAISMAFSPDGRVLAVGLIDGRIKLIDAAAGNELGTLSGHSGAVASVAFSPNGRILASASDDRTVKLWDMATNGSEIVTLSGFSHQVFSAVFSPDGRLLAANSADRTIRLWDLAAGRELRGINGYAVGRLAFSPDGRAIAAGSSSHRVTIWDVATGREVRTMRGHGDYVAMVAFSPDGRILASSSYDETVKFWEVTSGREITSLTGRLRLPSMLWASSLAFSPSGHAVALGIGDGPIRLWDTATWQELPPLGGRSVGVTSAQYSPDGHLIAFGSFDGTITIWDAASGRELRLLRGHSGLVNSIAFSPDGKVLASGGTDRTVKFWDVASGRELQTLTGHGEQVTSIAFSADGSLLASASGDRTVKLWDVASGTMLRTLSGHAAWINSVAFSPDGRMLASGSGELGRDGVNAANAIKLWDVASGSELRTLIGHAAWVTAVAFSRDGKLLASASGDRTVKLWDVASGREQRALGGFADRVACLAFAPDGRVLAVGSHDSTIKLWDFTGGDVRTLAAHGDLFASVAYAPDGQRLLSASWTSTVRVWNLATGKDNASLVAFTDGSWLAITPDGYYAASSEKAEENLNVRVGSRVFPVAAYRDKFFRPDLVKLSIAGRSLKELGFASIDSVKVAPIVELVDVPATTSEPKLTVSVRVTNGGGGIGQVRLFLNGSAVVQDGGGGAALASVGSTRTYTVQLTDGPNVLQAEAYNAENSMHSDSAIAKISANLPPANRGKLHALVVGIQEFANPKLKLAYPVRDAEMFAETLTTYSEALFGKPDIRMLTKPDETTREALIRAIKDMRANVAPDDLFVFYVASHGTTDDGEYFLITSNVGSVSSEHLKTDAISKEELTGLIANIPATKRLMVIDTCNAEALGNALLTRGLDEPTALKILSRAVGTTVLAASTSTQEALEGYQGHGLFSYVVAQGLAGKGDVGRDGFVSTLGLAHYVDFQVPEIAEREFNHKQFPVIEISGQEFPLTKVR